MTSPTTRLLLFATVGLAVAAGPVVAPASAASTTSAAAAVPGVRRVSAVTANSSAATQSVDATCRADEVVLGGGGRAVDTGSSRRLTLTRLEPSDRVPTPAGPRPGYRVTAAETVPGTDNQWHVEAFAICAQPVTGRHIVPGSTGSSSNSVQATAAVCPAGEVVLGSGARINNPSRQQVALQVARPSGPGDISRAQAHEDPDGYTGTWNLVAFAVCAPRPAGYHVAFGHSSADASEQEKAAAVFCADDEKALSAGAAISNVAPGNASLTEVLPLVESPSTPVGALATATENVPTDAEWDFIAATAVCADR